jgi:hypothetical protein
VRRRWRASAWSSRATSGRGCVPGSVRAASPASRWAGAAARFRGRGLRPSLGSPRGLLPPRRGVLLQPAQRGGGRPGPSPPPPPEPPRPPRAPGHRELSRPASDQTVVAGPPVQHDQMPDVDAERASAEAHQPRKTPEGDAGEQAERHHGLAHPVERRPGRRERPVLEPGLPRARGAAARRRAAGPWPAVERGRLCIPSASAAEEEERRPGKPKREVRSGCPRKPRQSHLAFSPTGQLTVATNGTQRASTPARRPARSPEEGATGAPRRRRSTSRCREARRREASRCGKSVPSAAMACAARARASGGRTRARAPAPPGESPSHGVGLG